MINNDDAKIGMKVITNEGNGILTNIYTQSLFNYNFPHSCCVSLGNSKFLLTSLDKINYEKDDK